MRLLCFQVEWNIYIFTNVFQAAFSLASYNFSGRLNLNKCYILRASPFLDICHSVSRDFLGRENLSKGIKAFCFPAVTDLSGSVIKSVINSVISIYHQHGMKWFYLALSTTNPVRGITPGWMKEEYYEKEDIYENVCKIYKYEKNINLKYIYERGCFCKGGYTF